MSSETGFSSTSLESVSVFWKEFNLEKRRSEFDAIGFKIAEQQDESVQKRRGLATSTQQFKKSADSLVISAVGDLLKQYQHEIDRLTQRAKYSERAFLDVYNHLYEAPDPSTGLEMAIKLSSKVTELENTVQKQSQELAEYSAESEEIRNQHSTIRRLEEKIRSLEGALLQEQNKTEEINEELRLEMLEEMQSQKDGLQKMLEEANQTIESMRRLHQASQDKLFSMEAQNEKLKARYVAELEMAAAEIEKANHRIVELETEKQNEQKSRQQQDEEILKRETEALKLQLTNKQSEITELQIELDSARVSLKSQEQELGKIVADLKKQIEQKETLLESLEEELSHRPHEKEMEELRKQLRILQAVQYNADDDGTTDSMETLLLKKNKHLEHQLTTERLKKAEISQELEEQKRVLRKAKDDLEQSQTLVSKLEADLLTAQESKGLRAVSSTSEMEDSGTAEESSQSMVGILRNQRDRLRQKTQDLETRLHQTEKQMKQIQLESKTVGADNVALVERVKYLQGYRKDHSNREDIEIGLAAEQKYSKAYEERMNPFREFQGRQRERKRRELGFLDRTVFIVGDLVFGNKYARLFVCLYLILLHLLVMSMLWFHSHKHTAPELSEEGVESFCKEHGYMKVLKDDFKTL